MNILMVNFPAEGHVNPTLGIVKAFADRGDNVHYITTEKFKERLEGVGAIVHLHSDLLRKASIDPFTPSGLNAFINIHIQTSLDILEITKQLSETTNFDFIIYDKFGAGELVRDYLHIPSVSSSASFLMPEKEFKPMLGPDSFQPDENAEKLLDQMKAEFDVVPKNMLQFMNNSGEINIVYTSRYFQPDNELFGEDYVFIGPSFPQRKTTDHFSLEALKDHKVLYISMGTVLDHVEQFFNTCIDAFSDFEGKVVIAAGEKADFTKIKQAPENFIISPYVPQLDVLNLSDVIITHGGMNSVNEAIHYNVPLVVIPHDKDQPMVAQRLTELGAGFRLSKDNIDANSLKDAVNEVLSNSEYKEAIQKINDSFQECGGPEKAIGVIDSFLKNAAANN
ncbi:glycosyltransferase, MGT family [Paenibacillus sophorae]|uniref:Glycosyltransferase, MGT family n=1 Tax=Paenibacillus sophorae TaxID=1333845 RepID=A0A1H8KEL1_9BACL|nr:macrolide family glycosyltransferase [Paenibacillus sophorae]QWU13720.1 UDP-glucosyltransferase [Paenibacillus sophorae]SEN91285.1 glycosyltransferase, MGT family [Paenibacillus sophorae]